MNDFETKLKQAMQTENSVPDADAFISDLHSERKNRQSARRQFYNGIVAGMLILSFGLFTVSQLGTNPAELIVYDSFEIMSEEDRIEEEFLREMAVYYLEESDDIWDTYALLNDSELFNEKWENQ
ncbi:MAG: hypothetical protein HOD97_07595 [Candidatus Marinimicrobia bacterium]|jgi:hypothetical protein|nr:hypothetical protein [Candidatus Neomarinimicrobiota bacterium]MBT3618354.1 hypothetical protein [Candidatus Neomarinimicrobiota bacterium]MBT3829149.1 hypothetical protein [Candidatus Neomarinimicrobiota bacterium]MBT3998117.1 hypothetical protein [Candidatus Neomarinimicrobiota bacterium]MBT4281458.1 hypothetical protein [Candidatus Neomarinimicrobiota bacterium]